MDMQFLAEMTDADLLARVKFLVHSERRATAALVAHLAEIENRKLYLGQACASLFVYCTRVLHLSEHAAYNRIEAARAARRFPAVLASLERGLVHLTAVRLLAPVLTGENHHELLAQATHKSKREIEELVARLRPQPDVPAQVRKLPERKQPHAGSDPVAAAAVPAEAPAAAAGPAAAAAACTVNPAGVSDGVATAPAPGPPAKSAIVVPLAPERYKVQFTVGAATREKLDRAQQLLRHRIPNGDLAEVVDLALDLLVQELEKQKFAAVARPRSGGKRDGERASRHIPAAVKREVWERDRGRCAFSSPDGARCGERGGLEFDHIRPHADGGAATTDNIRLLCRRHNQHEAQQYYGLWQAEAGAGMLHRRGIQTATGPRRASA